MMGAPSSSALSSVRRKFKPLILSSSDDDDEETLGVNKCLFKTPSSSDRCRIDVSPVHDKKTTSSSASPKSSSSDLEDFGSATSQRKPLRPIQRSSTDCSDADEKSAQEVDYGYTFHFPLKSGRKEKRDENVQCDSSSQGKRLSSVTNTAAYRDDHVVQHVTDVGQLEKMIGHSLKVSDRKASSESNLSSLPKDNYFTPKKPVIAQVSSTSSSTVKRMGKVTPYTFSGRKLKPVLLVSDEETSTDEDDPVTPIARTLCGNSGDGRPTAVFSFLKSLSPSTPAMQADQKALKFRDNFKGMKVELAQYLYHLFNEKVFSNKLPVDMALVWNGSLTSTAGYCKTIRKEGVTTCAIHLSTKVLTTADRLRDTLLHEMCHAAVRLISKLKEVHGPMWNTWALRCTIAFPDVKVPKRCHNYDIVYKYSYKCTNCGKTYGRHRQSIDVARHKCGKCRGTLKLCT